MRVPELAGDPEPVELQSALTQAIEVLLVGELEGGAHAPPRVPERFRDHAALGGLTKQPGARGVEKGQTDRARGRLDAQIAGRETHAFAIDDLERDGGPAPRADIGWAGRVPFVRQLDAHDA